MRSLERTQNTALWEALDSQVLRTPWLHPSANVYLDAFCGGERKGVCVPVSVCSCRRMAWSGIPQVGREPGAERGGEGETLEKG